MINNRIKSLRVISKLSQSDLAQMVGCSRQTIYRIEEKLTIPSIKIAFKIAHVLNQPIDNVFSYDKQKTH